MDHWEQGKIWTHLYGPKHQARLGTLAGMAEGETGIDIGCAYGHSTMIMAGGTPQLMRWTGVDFSHKAINGAKRHFPAGDWRLAGDFEALGALGKFDSVVCSEVLEHVLEDFSLAYKLTAMFNRRLLITTPVVKVNDPGHVRLYTKRSLLQLMNPTLLQTDEVDVFTDKYFIYLAVRRKA